MDICVFGLWHLGSVTAACAASAASNRVVGLDFDAAVVEGLQNGKAPLAEPGLDARIRQCLDAGSLRFTADPAEAMRDAEVLWVTFDTPVDERDVADVAYVRRQLDRIADQLRPGTLVLISSQVPVGFTASLARDWAQRDLRYACSPENLRLGKAIEVFEHPERVIVGTDDEADRPQLTKLFSPWCDRIEFMTVASAEMTKHALNAFLATSVVFANEMARLCEVVGADAKQVERGLKTEGRIGPKAYLSPGAAFAGGTLARDVRFLVGFGDSFGVGTPLFDGVIASNDTHKGWLRDKVQAAMRSGTGVAAVLGLTYKPATDTLRRSASIELCRWLASRGASVRAHDPAIKQLPPDLSGVLTLCSSAQDALRGADVAVVATEWPDYRQLVADDFVAAMAVPTVIDQNWFLAGVLSADPRITYIAPGRAGQALRPAK